MSERFTGYGEGHQGSDLPLEAVGGDAGVVAGIASSDFGEMELAVSLLHVRRQLSSVCRGRQRDTQETREVGRAGVVIHVGFKWLIRLHPADDGRGNDLR